MGLWIAVLGPFLVAVYTINYARWAWGKGIRGGAVGLYALALLTVALPLLTLWVNS